MGKRDNGANRLREQRGGGYTETLPHNHFEFGYYPNWMGCLDALEDMAQPERWAFPDDIRERYNNVNPLLERYLAGMFARAAALYNDAATQEERDQLVTIRPRYAAWDTGLLTPQYAPILAYYEKNKREGERRWYFKGWASPGSPMLARAAPLPQRIPCVPRAPYNPAWPIRPNIEHITQDDENLKRIPPHVRKSKMLPLLIETGIEMARRQASICPGIVVPQLYQNRVQFLLPISLDDPERPDLALTLEPAAGYYTGSTMLTLQMAYMNARLAGRSLAPWIYEPMKGWGE